MIEPSDQMIEPSDQTIEPSDQTIEPSDQMIELSDQTIELSDQTIEPSDQMIEPSDQIRGVAKVRQIVIPAKAGIQCYADILVSRSLDFCLRRNDAHRLSIDLSFDSPNPHAP